MSSAASEHRYIYGVDFSGAKNACSKIWVCRAEVTGPRLSVLECYSLGQFSSSRQSREECFNALLDLIRSSKSSIFGMDFPFGVPVQLMQGLSWDELIRDFPQIYSNEYEFRDINRKLSGNVELKRLTDKEVKAPFCVYNLRLYRQTYFGIRDIIRPLVVSGAASILPFQLIRAGVPLLMEICPASTLKKEGLYIPYKGKGTKERTAREHILANLKKKALNLPEYIWDKALEDTDGDALDSIIAAYSVFSVRHMLSHQIEPQEAYIREGFTFM